MGTGQSHSLSSCGLVLGTLFFVVALTPSLLPRSFLTQGVISGCALTAGYGVGVLGRWLWTYLELPQPSGRLFRIVMFSAGIGVAGLTASFLWRAADWQNSVRTLMGLKEVDTAYPLEVALVALAIFASLIALALL